MRVLQLDEERVPEGSASAVERTRYLLGKQLRALERYDPGVRMDDDPEDLHAASGCDPPRPRDHPCHAPAFGNALDPLAGELKWLAGMLGPVRDLDVLTEHLSREIAGLDQDSTLGKPLLRGLARERRSQRKKLAAALDSERYLSFPTPLRTDSSG